MERGLQEEPVARVFNKCHIFSNGKKQLNSFIGMSEENLCIYRT